MPLYEYECAACHKRVEKIQKFSDPEITVCPHCGGRLERVLSAPAVSFKGGGWYADLYSSAKKPAGKSDAASSSGSSSSGDSGGASSGGASPGSGGASSGSSESKPASAPAASSSPSSSTAKS